MFGNLTEYLTDSQVDFTIPFSTGLPFTDVWSGLPAKLKIRAGVSLPSPQLRSPHLLVQSDAGRGVLPIDFGAPFNDILDPKNVGGGPPFPITFNEITNPQNAFEATHEIAAGYLMFDLPLVRDRLRLIAGVRTEYSYMKLDVFDQLQNKPTEIIKNDLDPLPGVNLVYSPRSDMNVRASWSRTVSRPEFRELSPAVYPATRGLRGLVGDPTLVETERRQLRPALGVVLQPSELVSLSGFYKAIDAPIETAVNVSGSAPQDTFKQGKDGKLAGFEFEGRRTSAFSTTISRT